MSIQIGTDLVVGLLGGGVLGSLITFFVTRHDSKKERISSFYKSVYGRLSEYNSALYDFLYGFIKNNSEVSDKISASKTNESFIIQQIEGFNKDINKYVRKCNKSGGPIGELCLQCQKKRDIVTQLYSKLVEEQSKQSSFLANQSSYWEARLDSLKDCAAKYSNMSTLLSSGGIAKRTIRNAVNRVDVKSVFFVGYRRQDIKDEFDVSELIIAQLENINVALKALSKEIKN